MKSILTNGEIGKRISLLRQVKDMSQDELAKSVGVSRTAITQIESGKRNISAMELMKFAETLNFSMDEIMSSDFKKYESLKTDEDEVNEEVRISVPEFNVRKFKNLILYILEQCAGKPNVGETVLNKLLYFSDFNYYELYEEHLSGASYRKLQMGPVPRDITEILHEMETECQLKSFYTDYFGYRQKRYFPLIFADKSLFNGAELDVVDRVIETLGGMSASEISRYSHGDMPWKASNERQVIDYELVFYREPPYSVRTYNEDCDD